VQVQWRAFGEHGARARAGDAERDPADGDLDEAGEFELCLLQEILHDPARRFDRPGQAGFRAAHGLVIGQGGEDDQGQESRRERAKDVDRLRQLRRSKPS
jgi:hypothetical protein